MKFAILSSAVLAIVGLASTSMAADYADWVAQGYRWSVAHGRVAFTTKEEAKNAGNKAKSDTAGHGYYLRPGKLVLVVETDAASGLSKIRMRGVASDLWTATKNLSSRPVENARGVIETPDKMKIAPPKPPR